MKTLKYLAGLAISALIAITIPGTFVVTSVSLSSCKDTVETLNVAPQLIVNPPTSQAFDVNKGEVVTFHMESRSNANTSKDLQDLTMHVSYSAGGTWDTTWNAPSGALKYFVTDYTYTVPTGANWGDVITITLTLTDKDAKNTKKTYILTVTDNSGLNTYYVTLGSWQSSVPSFFASGTGQYFTVSTAQSSGQSKVDLVYFYGSTNAATMASPDDNSFGTGAGQISSYNIQNWTTKKATRFHKIPDSDTAYFNNLTSLNIQNLYITATTPEESKANTLIDETSPHPSWVVYKSGTKYGIFRVRNINGYAADGTIDIVVRFTK